MANELIGIVGAIAYIGLGIAVMLWAGRPWHRAGEAQHERDAQCPSWLVALGNACRTVGPWWMLGAFHVGAERGTQHRMQEGRG